MYLTLSFSWSTTSLIRSVGLPASKIAVSRDSSSHTTYVFEPNIPFVNRFAPTVEVDFRLWIETVIEEGKEILQLQYEQIIFFEFDFGNDGGTTSWPHIQVNTLRKIEDIPADQRKIIEEQFLNAPS